MNLVLDYGSQLIIYTSIILSGYFLYKIIQIKGLIKSNAANGFLSYPLAWIIHLASILLIGLSTDYIYKMEWGGALEKLYLFGTMGLVYVGFPLILFIIFRKIKKTKMQTKV
jgi:hypothetical protein